VLSQILPPQRRSWTSEQQVAFWLGLWFVVNGIGAFVYTTSFATAGVVGDLNGWSPLTLNLNGWHALFHLVPGLLGVTLASRPAAAARWARSVVVLYVTAGVWGLITGGNALGFMAVERFGSMVHLVEAVPALWAVLHAAGLWRTRPRRVEVLSVTAVTAPLLGGALYALVTGSVLSMCCCGSC
jgi:hypothetical protein